MKRSWYLAKRAWLSNLGLLAVVLLLVFMFGFKGILLSKFIYTDFLMEGNQLRLFLIDSIEFLVKSSIFVIGYPFLNALKTIVYHNLVIKKEGYFMDHLREDFNKEISGEM